MGLLLFVFFAVPVFRMPPFFFFMGLADVGLATMDGGVADAGAAAAGVAAEEVAATPLLVLPLPAAALYSANANETEVTGEQNV